MIDVKHQTRTGRYVRQPAGYKAFLPATLPFQPPLRYDDEMLMLLSNADQAIGRLDASADMLPNPDLFVRMYVTKEAVLSSQIEGITQASLSEVMQHEASGRRRAMRSDIAEIMNYVNAMNQGLERLKTLPLSNRLIREIHAQLILDVRGAEKEPGAFRRTQNWIGSSGSYPDLRDALFIPPPPDEMIRAMGDLELYLHENSGIPILVKAGLVHYQFETIHPFLDGNGRMGRLLVVFYLCQQGILKRPLLYLSVFINEHKNEYYERLQAVRDYGDIEGWMRFFLTAVWRVSESAARTAHAVLALRERHRGIVQERFPNSNHPLQLLDTLYDRPLLTVKRASSVLGVSYPTANSLVAALAELGILQEITGRERNRRFMYEEYLDILESGLATPEGVRTT